MITHLENPFISQPEFFNQFVAHYDTDSNYAVDATEFSQGTDVSAFVSNHCPEKTAYEKYQVTKQLGMMVDFQIAVKDLSVDVIEQRLNVLLASSGMTHMNSNNLTASDLEGLVNACRQKPSVSLVEAVGFFYYHATDEGIQKALLEALGEILLVEKGGVWDTGFFQLFDLLPAEENLEKRLALWKVCLQHLPQLADVIKMSPALFDEFFLVGENYLKQNGTQKQDWRLATQGLYELMHKVDVQHGLRVIELFTELLDSPNTDGQPQEVKKLITALLEKKYQNPQARHCQDPQVEAALVALCEKVVSS